MILCVLGGRQGNAGSSLSFFELFICSALDFETAKNDFVEWGGHSRR